MGFIYGFQNLLLLVWICSLSQIRPQSPDNFRNSTQSLDKLLQDYAFRALVRPQTGVVYDAEPPSNFSGIKLAALRLRRGSLRSRGVKNYKEFEIPDGVIVTPYTKRLALVYQNLGNWSSVYYPLPGYIFLAPVLGLFAYDAVNVTEKGQLELDLFSSANPILIRFPDVRKMPANLVPKCLWFDKSDSQVFSNVTQMNVCSTTGQGHFSIVVESSLFTPSPNPPPTQDSNDGFSNGLRSDRSKIWKIVASVVGGFSILVLISLLILLILRYREKKTLKQMQLQAEIGEPLQMTLIGSSRVPIAPANRTKPIIENEYRF